jgi:hypothetical protein
LGFECGSKFLRWLNYPLGRLYLPCALATNSIITKLDKILMLFFSQNYFEGIFGQIYGKCKAIFYLILRESWLVFFFWWIGAKFLHFQAMDPATVLNVRASIQRMPTLRASSLSIHNSSQQTQSLSFELFLVQIWLCCNYF